MSIHKDTIDTWKYFDHLKKKDFSGFFRKRLRIWVVHEWVNPFNSGDIFNVLSEPVLLLIITVYLVILAV